MTTNDLTNQFLIEVSKQLPNVIAWRSNRIEAVATGRDGKLRRVSAGIDGQGDISGIASVMIGGKAVGVRVEIEIKFGRDQVRKSQVAFRSMIESAGGVYVLVRDVTQGIADLKAALSTYE